MNRVFGDIAGFPEGCCFATRREVSLAGVHRPPQAGISGSKGEGADSIVLSGGYEDDMDWGDVILYTGHGGRDYQTGQQVADQTLSQKNLALAVSRSKGLPVRVVRGAGSGSRFAPRTGYRYDGLYLVEDAFRARGRSGHYVWRFRLRKRDQVGRSTFPSAAGAQASQVHVTSVLYESRAGLDVKELYDYRCQICGEALRTPGGLYAEAVHVRPIGSPHEGADVAENILCLCPNHRVLFSTGAVALSDNLEILPSGGQLNVHRDHRLDMKSVQYHRAHYFDGAW